MKTIISDLTTCQIYLTADKLLSKGRMYGSDLTKDIYLTVIVSTAKINYLTSYLCWKGGFPIQRNRLSSWRMSNFVLVLLAIGFDKTFRLNLQLLQIFKTKSIPNAVLPLLVVPFDFCLRSSIARNSKNYVYIQFQANARNQSQAIRFMRTSENQCVVKLCVSGATETLKTLNYMLRNTI